MGATVASTTVVWPRGVEQYHGAAVAAGGDRLTHPRPQAAIAAQGFELPAIGGSPGQTAPGVADQQQGGDASAFEQGIGGHGGTDPHLLDQSGGDRLGRRVHRWQAHDRTDR